MGNGTSGCVGATCDWAISGEHGNGIGIDCLDGLGNCREARILEADSSSFHDQTLIEATRKIRHILSGIPKDSRGRKLSFVLTNMGMLLAWVNHSATPPKGGVTAKDNDATVAKALKLKGVPAGGA